MNNNCSGLPPGGYIQLPFGNRQPNPRLLKTWLTVSRHSFVLGFVRNRCLKAEQFIRVRQIERTTIWVNPSILHSHCHSVSVKPATCSMDSSQLSEVIYSRSVSMACEVMPCLFRVIIINAGYSPALIFDEIHCLLLKRRYLVPTPCH